MTLRTKFTELKKMIPKLCIPLEATLRAKLAAASKPDDEKEQEKCAKNVETQKAAFEK